ncbi:hypothetical protein [Thermaurantimonas sp.]|uniref:hypothetical protein n=1 Tax=Thermaurantimonas sp. TaxID=2681568 RepID=UPI00391A3002
MTKVLFVTVSAQNINPRFVSQVYKLAAEDTLKLPERTYLPSLQISVKSSYSDSCLAVLDSGFAYWNRCEALEVEISYYLLPDRFLASVEGLDRKKIVSKASLDRADEREAIVVKSTNRLFESDFAGISRTGAISRAVRVGSNQSAVLNSTLDLQISGTLPDSTTIKASIADNRVPIQPDGYSQQLRDIDRIYMEVSHPNRGKLVAGDYSIANSDHYFLTFDRRVTGIGISTHQSVNKSSFQLSGELNGAASRGIFARNSFMGQEGNQGPYKLFGNNNELFIVIVSGSERVYIDGHLLTRGQENDYVIDYNAGEITFTALRPITRDRRIVVEFQYTTLLYLRTVGYAKAGISKKRLKAEIVHYQESDSRNQTLFQDLTDQEKMILAQAGTDLNQMQIPTAVAVSYVSDEILYEKVAMPGFGDVFVYSRDSTRQLYRVQFSFVGQGKGNYVQANKTLNGRVYEWIAPVNGQPQGSYEPVKQLIPPQALRISSLKTTFDGERMGNIELQLAASQKDVNRYSLSESQTYGLALRAKHGFHQKIGKTLYKSQAFVDWMQSTFTTVERVRQVEFQRDWALTSATGSENQFLMAVSIGLEMDSTLQMQAEYSLLNQGSEQRNKVSAEVGSKTKFLNFTSRISVLSISGNQSRGSFFRQNGDVRFLLLKALAMGVRTDVERNVRSFQSALVDGSYQFYYAEPYVRISDKRANYLELFTIVRTDDTVYNQVILNAARSHGAGVRTDWRWSSNVQVNSSLLYRKIDFQEVVNQQDFAAYTGRIRLQQRWLRSSLLLNTFLESGTGTEPRRIFSYIEVPAGTGTHTWIDYNENGIKELDEFEPARFPAEARYLRIFAPSSDFIRVEFNKLSQSILFNPAVFSQKLTGGIGRYLTRFSIQSTLQYDSRRQLNNNVNKLFYLSALNASDTAVLGAFNQQRHTLFFDRSKNKFGWDISYLTNSTANLLSFGIEEVRKTEHPFNVRWRVLPPIIARFTFNIGQRENISQNFVNRNFSFREILFNPKLEFQPNERYRLSIGIERSLKTSQQAMLSSWRLLTENYLASASSYAITSTVQWVRNAFTGEANSPLGFSMLEGLQAGDNVIVNLQIQRNLATGLQISLTYEARWGQQMTFIQNGAVQLKAFF